MEKYLNVSAYHSDKRYRDSIIVLPILFAFIIFAVCLVAGGFCVRQPDWKAFAFLALAVLISGAVSVPYVAFVKSALRKRTLYRSTRGREFIFEAETVSVSIGLIKGPVEKVLMKKGAEYLKFKYSDVERWRIPKNGPASNRFYEVRLRTLPESFRIFRDPFTMAKSETELLRFLDDKLVRPVRRN